MNLLRFTDLCRRHSLVLAPLAIAAQLGLPLAQAADSSNGCGLGWELTSKQSLLSSAIRQTTNTILPNTFSMTSGTSGCAKHEIVQNDERAVYYAVNNYDSILPEIAQGQGEFLAAFGEALGCDANAQVLLGQKLQSETGAILENARDGVALYREVRTRMATDPVLGACRPQV